MSERVDELFGGAGTEARPRVALVVALAVGGVLSSAVGLACSVVPGVLLVLLSWGVVERELDRVDSGFLPLADRRRLLGLRTGVWVLLAVVTGLAFVQLVGMWTGVYPRLWGDALRDWMSTHPELTPPTPPP